MEFFEDKFIPLQIRIKGQDGKEHIVSTKILTNKTIREMEKMQKSTDMSGSEIISKTMVTMFDKPAEFWDNFSLEFMNNLITYATEKLKKKPMENSNTDG